SEARPFTLSCARSIVSSVPFSTLTPTVQYWPTAVNSGLSSPTPLMPQMRRVTETATPSSLVNALPTSEFAAGAEGGAASPAQPTSETPNPATARATATERPERTHARLIRAVMCLGMEHLQGVSQHRKETAATAASGKTQVKRARRCKWQSPQWVATTPSPARDTPRTGVRIAASRSRAVRIRVMDWSHVRLYG